MTSAASDATELRIGRYQVLSKLGEGGMAEVFLAEIRGTQGFTKRVVIKTLKPEHRGDAQQQSMFADEARVGSRMDFPHIVRVLELGEENGLPYMVQEYVEGPSLGALLKRQRERGRIDLRMGARIIADVARALHHAYHLTDDEGRLLKVVHRDISPGNILVARQGVAKLIDFGVARFEHRETKTEGDLLKGKLSYLAPETLSHALVSHQTDLYALGVVLYSVTLGQPPWTSSNQIGRRMRGEFDAPSAIMANFPPELEGIILRCMAVDPTERFPDARLLAQSLDAWLLSTGGPVSNNDLAAFVEELFPEGPEGWQVPYDIDPNTMGNGATTYRRPPRQTATDEPPVALWGAALASVAVVGGLIAALVGVVVYNQPEPAPPPEPVIDEATARTRADFLTYLQLAADAADRGDPRLAARHLAALDELELDDAELLLQVEALRASIELLGQVKAIEELADDDPAEALRQARDLSRAHPDDDRLRRLLSDLESSRE
jgi:serine/threonine-protein kinase